MSVGYAAYIFLGDRQVVSEDNIKVDIIGPVSIGGGDKISVDVVVQNNNAATIESVDLVIEYPDGTKMIDLITDLKRERISLGDILPGAVAKKTLDLAFFGEDGDIKKIDFEIEYRLPGSTNYFDKFESFEVALSAAPVQIIVDGIRRLSAGQLLDLDIEVTSNSEQPIENLIFVANYPFGFEFDNATLEPSVGNNIWYIEDLKPNESKKFRISGAIQAQDNEERVFRFNAGIEDSENPNNIAINFYKTSHAVEVERPFVGLDIDFGGSTESTQVFSSGENITSRIIFTNNTDSSIRDLEFTVVLEGESLNEKLVKVSDGFYRSSDNTAVFNKDTQPDLEEVKPQEQRAMTFVLASNSLLKNPKNLKNPEIKISAEVKGSRISESGVEEDISEKEFALIKLQSDISVDVETLYQDQIFSNTGPIPPKVDTPTTYTVAWRLSNSTNNINGARVVGTLPSYVEWNDLTSPLSENVYLDVDARKIIWEVGNAPLSTGYNSPARAVYFQLTLTPSVNQIGGSPPLVTDINFSAMDEFTKTKIVQQLENPTTILEESTVNLHEYVIE